MAHEVFITGRDGEDVLLREIPDGQHDAQTVAAEMAVVAQRAFDLGRLAEGSILQREIEKTLERVRRNRPHT